MLSSELSPRDLARAIGVSESSVKRWADGGRFGSRRTAGGHRRIPVGEAIRFVRESGSELVRPEVLGLEDLGEAGGRHVQDGDADELYRILETGDAARAGAFLSGHFLAGGGPAEILDGPVRRAMARLGEAWHQDPARGIFAEHRALDVLLQAFQHLRSLVPAVPASAPRAVGAAPPGDPYLLPSQSAALVLQAEGFDAVNLGPDTPLPALREAARFLDARLVWISVSATGSPAKLAAGLRPWLSELEEQGAVLALGGTQAPRLKLEPHAALYRGQSMVELAAFARGLAAPAAKN